MENMSVPLIATYFDCYDEGGVRAEDGDGLLMQDVEEVVPIHIQDLVTNLNAALLGRGATVNTGGVEIAKWHCMPSKVQPITACVLHMDLH